MNEQWKPCMVGYEVSDAGNVRRSEHGRKTYAGRPLKASLMTIGYLSVAPTVDGKNSRRYVHDLVAAAFLGPKPAGASVNHIDGIKTNNAASSLEYVSHAENMRHAAACGLMARGDRHPQSKLTTESVKQLRRDRESGMSFSRLARRYGVSIATAFNAANGKNWSHAS